jgi:hypothetical protein
MAKQKKKPISRLNSEYSIRKKELIATSRFKGGRVSRSEKLRMKDDVEHRNMTVLDIATSYNRHPDTVEAILRGLNVNASTGDEESKQTSALAEKLQSRDYWYQLEFMFDKGELEQFISLWCELMMQFNDDVLFAEELQIKQYVTLEILNNRLMIDRRNYLHKLNEYTEALDEEYMKPDEERDNKRVNYLEGRIKQLQSTISSYEKDYKEGIKQADNVLKNLKATRDQRLKQVDHSKSSWPALVRALQNEKMRNEMSREAELMRIAKERQVKKLQQHHTFNNDEIDRPFLLGEGHELYDPQDGFIEVENDISEEKAKQILEQEEED